MSRTNTNMSSSMTKTKIHAPQPRRAVRFEEIPDVRVIPDYMGTWAEGERDRSPTYEQMANKEKMTEQALAEATKQERSSRFHEDFDAPYQRVPSISAAGKKISTVKAFQVGPLPTRRGAVYQKSPSHDFCQTANSASDVPAVPLFQPAFCRAATTHTFDQFLTPEHDKSWQDLDNAKSAKGEKKPLKRAATFGAKRATFGLGKLIKGLEKVEQKVEAHRGGLH